MTKREKTLKTVITFASTADAMFMESVAREHGVAGRIIPVPSEIDAGCGLAWCVESGEKDALLAAAAKWSIAYEGVFEVPLY